MGKPTEDKLRVANLILKHKEDSEVSGLDSDNLSSSCTQIYQVCK